ncbi:unnamed protein product [Prunus armeniaca]|uniref:NADH:quinone oxidoreductase/Mrp antiporter transmembrane domain-containing protein n=1 Tax=Prunus armeniaca TaxID=36596 RepID=A0A6J5V413_PRUAR|nr:unnamed protein product [Prunus armeniaca]CAB4312803.1 unnamed protein product [Prunus armeniaca]
MEVGPVNLRGLSATRIFDIPFYFSSNEWHLLLEILAILSMILGNLIAITQTSMKRMLAYSSIGQIGYVIIGIIVGDSNGGYASMITYMLFYISMNLGTFACIVLFGAQNWCLQHFPSTNVTRWRQSFPWPNIQTHNSSVDKDEIRFSKTQASFNYKIVYRYT